MKHNFKKLAWIVLGAIIASSVLILFLWLAHLTGLTTGDDGNAISVLGGIMGAIFTAGGIIVALVAVLSQIQLQDRVKQEIDGAKQALIDDFNNVLRKDLEQEIRRQVDGILAFFQATNVGDWEQAEQLISQALQFYPKLEGARRFLGVSVAQQIEISFSGSLPQGPNHAADITSFLTSLSLGTQYLQRPNPAPNSRAIHWLEDALSHGEDIGHEVSLHLALIYGYDGDYTRLQERLDVLKGDQSALDYLRMPSHLIMLLYACQGNELSVKNLIQEIDYTLPDHKAIQEAVKTAPFSASVGVQCIDWYAFERNQRGIAQLPVRVRLFPPNKDEETYALIFAKNKPFEAVPSGTNPDNSGQKLEKLDELISDLFKRFLFICRADQI